MSNLARKMKRKETKKPNKEALKQARLTAKSNAIAKELNQRIDRDIYNAEFRAFVKTTILTNWVLHRYWGFSKDRLQQFQDKMAWLCACIQDEHCDITLEDINKQIIEETNFDTLSRLNRRRYNADAEPVEK